LFDYDLELSVVGSVETKKAIMSSPLVDMVVTWMSERDEKLSAQCGMKCYSQIRGFLFTGNLCFPCSLVFIAGGLIIFCITIACNPVERHGYRLISLTASALRNLTADSLEAKAFVCAHGAVKAIISLLGSPNADARIHAAGFVMNLANSNDEIHQFMLEQGVILYLVLLLQNAQDESQLPAITALSYLSSGADSIKNEIIKVEGAQVALKLMESTNHEASKAAVTVIQHLTHQSSYRQTEMMKLRPMPVLRKAFSQNGGDIPMLNSIAAFASMGDDARKAISQEGLVSLSTLAFIDAIDKNDLPRASAAANALLNIANGPESVRHDLLKAEALVHAIPQLTSSHEELQFNCVAMVCGMSHGKEDVRSAIIKVQNASEKLIACCSSPQKRVREYAADALWSICETAKEPIKKELTESGIIPAASALLEDVSVEVSFCFTYSSLFYVTTRFAPLPLGSLTIFAKTARTLACLSGNQRLRPYFPHSFDRMMIHHSHVCAFC
jgi:hypothetical protein